MKRLLIAYRLWRDKTLRFTPSRAWRTSGRFA